MICIDAVGYEAVGHTGGIGNGGNNNSGSIKHDHTEVSNLAYGPANPMQVINWMSQAARNYSIISIPGVYAATYDQFSLGPIY